MKIYTNKITAVFILLSLGMVLFVGFFGYSEQSHISHGSMGTADCPFMAHEDSLCPMSAFDHLSVLKNIFEAAVFKIQIFKFFFGLILATSLYLFKPRWWQQINTSAFLRWRQKIEYEYSVRRYQELFANGLLNPKLF